MTDLITRLTKLDAPDREVDAQIDRALGLHVDVGEFSGPWTRYPEPDHYRRTTPYTASVDAAIALARRIWPDVMYRVGNHAEGYDPSLYLGEIFIPGETQRDYFTGVASSDAIALCIALLRAKEASKL